MNAGLRFLQLHTPLFFAVLMATVFSFVLTVAIQSSGLVSGVVIDATRDAPNVHQLDFWLIWLFALLTMTLPLLILEFALAKRSKNMPLLAMQTLTREADASTRFRLIAWIGVVAVSLLAGKLIWLSQLQAQHAVHFPVLADIPLVMWAGFAVLALVLMCVPRAIMPVAVLTLVGGGLASLMDSGASSALVPATTNTWAWTAIASVDVVKAVFLAVIASGVGLGIYWTARIENIQLDANEDKTSVVKKANIVLVVLVVAGLLWASVHGLASVFTMPLIMIMLNVCLAGFLLSFVLKTLRTRQIALPIQAVIILGAVAIWVLPIQFILSQLVFVLLMLTVIGYCVFAGFFMKSSHLRKAIGFSSEMTYNFWRFAIRLYIPILLLVCLGLYFSGDWVV